MKLCREPCPYGVPDKRDGTALCRLGAGHPGRHAAPVVIEWDTPPEQETTP